MSTNKAKRYVIFLMGLFISSFGVSVITKAELGTSPISAIPYVLSLNFPASLGAFTVYFSFFLIFLQLLILRRNFKLEHILQIPISFLFGYFIDMTMALVGDLIPQAYGWRLFFLLIGCVILGFGVFIEVLADVAMLPGESFVRAVSGNWKTDFGTTKICFDVSMTVLAIILSFIFSHQLQGVREGTIIAAFSVGFIARLMGRKLKFMSKLVEEPVAVQRAMALEGSMTEHWVISIGRQYGSGGREIGAYLAKQLGYAFYDKEMITEIAGITGYSEEFISKNEESMGNRLIHDLFNQMYVYSNTDEAPKDIIFGAQSQVVQNCVNQSNCVIVGRCSDYILRGHQKCVSLFLHAPIESRVQRIVETEHLDEKNARQAIEKTDKRRSDNYQYYTDQIWGYSDHYDLCIDSRLGKSFILEAVKEVMNKKEGLTK